MRKLYLFLLFFSLVSLSIDAQGTKAKVDSRPAKWTPKAKAKPRPAVIPPTLVTDLKLSPEQKTKMNDAIYMLLVEKKKANSMNRSERKSYINSTFSKFNNSVQTILTGAQYSTFLNLKPGENDKANRLSPLFY